jgi:hypothetical protein
MIKKAEEKFMKKKEQEEKKRQEEEQKKEKKKAPTKVGIKKQVSIGAEPPLTIPKKKKREEYSIHTIPQTNYTAMFNITVLQ